MAVFKRDKLIDISKRSEGGALVKRLESEIKELDREVSVLESELGQQVRENEQLKQELKQSDERPSSNQDHDEALAESHHQIEKLSSLVDQYELQIKHLQENEIVSMETVGLSSDSPADHASAALIEENQQLKHEIELILTQTVDEQEQTIFNLQKQVAAFNDGDKSETVSILNEQLAMQKEALVTSEAALTSKAEELDVMKQEAACLLSANQTLEMTYGKSSDYAQITGETFMAEVENIRQPTNSDKRIYGHVEIPLAFPVEGGDQMRDADTDEVWVTLKLYRLKLKLGGIKYDPISSSGIDVGASYDVVTYEKEVPTIGHKGVTTGENKDIDGVHQFGESKTYGIFEWDLSQDETIKKDKGDPFLWAGEYVEVIQVRRGGGGKKPDETFDIISTVAKQNLGKYVFNVRPIEVSSHELVDPILGKLAAKTQVSDATKEIELGVTTKDMRSHLAFVPLKVIEKGKDDQQKAKLKNIVTGWVNDYERFGGRFPYLPMITTGQETTVDPVGTADLGAYVASIDLLNPNKQAAFLRPRTYLSADQTTANQPSELFVMSGWVDDISSLGKDLPPTYQEVSSLTTRDANELSEQVKAFWANIDDKKIIAGLKMPAKKSPYHDAVFDASPKLNLTPVVPKALAIDLTKKGKGTIEQVDITESSVVTYQLKLMSPNLLATPTEMLMGYQVTFTVTGQAEICDTSDLILPAGVTETHTAKSITFTSKRIGAPGEVVRIHLAVTGDFEIEMTGGGRTPQEKALSMPRGIWDVKGEQHNANGDVFRLHQPLPPADDASFQEYYHLLKAPDRKISVKLTKDSVKTPVYLSIRDSKLTVYYKQLKQGSDIKVTVDGKALTSFKVDNSDVEQSKPLNFKINGTRNIVAVTYTLADGTTKTVTWRNPKISN